jgi:hypothetical protein
MRLGSAGLLVGLLCGVSACRDRVGIVARPAGDAAAVPGNDGAGGGGGTSEAGAGGATAGQGPPGGVTPSGGGGASGRGGSPGASGGSAGTASGGSAGGASADADAGTAADASAPADAGPTCALDRDCPRPATPCAVRRCSQGRCAAANAQSGTIIPDVPGDCHDVVCDGEGGVTSRLLDENNVPVFENQCLAGTCDKAGVAGTEPLSAGAPCRLAGGGKVCDGSGHCVQCLLQSDCAPGLHCQRDHTCGTTPCTDVACGGGCMLCDLGGRCLANSDCKSNACDTAAESCISDSCKDNHRDGYESDVDCGGYTPCPRCPTGGRCDAPNDCETRFCDVVMHQCVTAASGCSDHAVDGDETDVDCGGTVCAPCASGQYCKSSSDCQAGLHCSGAPQACY